MSDDPGHSGLFPPASCDIRLTLATIEHSQEEEELYVGGLWIGRLVGG